MTCPGLVTFRAYPDWSWVSAFQDFLKVGCGYCPMYRDSGSMLAAAAGGRRLTHTTAMENSDHGETGCQKAVQ